MRELDRLCESYEDLLRHLDPAAANAAGSVLGDGRLRQFDREAIREHVAAFRATAAAIEDLDVQDLADEIDRTALLDDVRVTIARLEEDRAPIRNPRFWIDHLAQALAAYVFPPDAAVVEGLGDCVAGIPTFLDSARATLRRPPHLLVDGALAALGGVGELLVQVASTVAANAPPSADPRVATAELEAFNAIVTQALKALTTFGHWLRSEVEPEPVLAGAVLGEARFERRMHHRYAIREGPAGLWRYAAHLLEETEAALAAEARNSGASWRELVKEAEEETVPAAAAMAPEVEQVRKLLGEGGMTVPPGPEVLVAPPFLRSLFPAATYLPPTQPRGTAIPRLVLPAAQVSASAAPAIAAAALAGRHLQEVSAQALSSTVRRTLRARMAVQGWALYAEEWMAERGLYASPAARLVRLVRLLRAAGRLAVDIGIHARGMTLEDAMTLLTDRAGFTRGEADAELRYCLAYPTDGAAAALGRREILALRVAAASGGGALDRFHADLLQYGALSPGLAAWGMGLAG
jgi:hypothetical protein